MEWRPVLWAPQYEISEDGFLRRDKKMGGYFYQKVQYTDRGYRRFTLSIKGKGRPPMTAAQLVAEAFLGPRSPGMTVNHKDGVKTNDHWTNLEYLTRIENIQHAHRLGLMPKTRTLLTWYRAEAIRAYAMEHPALTYAAISRIFECSTSVVSLVLRGKTFRTSPEDLSQRRSLAIRRGYQNGTRRILRGGENPNSKLTSEQWKTVVEAIKAGQSRRSLAREYGVSHTIINAQVKKTLDNT